MCDAEEDWLERSFRASGVFEGGWNIICFFSTNRKSYFQSLISADSANSVNSFDNSINTVLYVFVCTQASQTCQS